MVDSLIIPKDFIHSGCFLVHWTHTFLNKICSNYELTKPWDSFLSAWLIYIRFQLEIFFSVQNLDITIPNSCVNSSGKKLIASLAWCLLFLLSFLISDFDVKLLLYLSFIFSRYFTHFEFLYEFFVISNFYSAFCWACAYSFLYYILRHSLGSLLFSFSLFIDRRNVGNNSKSSLKDLTFVKLCWLHQSMSALFLSDIPRLRGFFNLNHGIRLLPDTKKPFLKLRTLLSFHFFFRSLLNLFIKKSFGVDFLILFFSPDLCFGFLLSPFVVLMISYKMTIVNRFFEFFWKNLV